MAHVMDVWTKYHPKERVISSDARLAAVNYSEEHGLEECNIEIFVKDYLERGSYTFISNQLNYGYAPDGGYAG